MLSPEVSSCFANRARHRRRCRNEQLPWRTRRCPGRRTIRLYHSTGQQHDSTGPDFDPPCSIGRKPQLLPTRRFQKAANSCFSTGLAAGKERTLALWLTILKPPAGWASDAAEGAAGASTAACSCLAGAFGSERTGASSTVAGGGADARSSIAGTGTVTTSACTAAETCSCSAGTFASTGYGAI